LTIKSTSHTRLPACAFHRPGRFLRRGLVSVFPAGK
jgi:hypothetical protein